MKSLYLVFFLTVFLFGHFSYSETIECREKNLSSFSLKFSTSVPETTPSSLKAKLKVGFLSRTQNLSLKLAPRNNVLSYTDYWNPKSFWLNMGEYHGLGRYSNVQFTSDEGTKHTYVLDCDLTGPMQFRNYCDLTPDNNPQQNLFMAVRQMNGDLLEATLPCEVDVNALNQNQCSPLLVLSDINCGTGLFDAYAAYDIKDMVQSLIQAGASVDARDPITQATPLIKLARLQDMASVKNLIEARASINAQDGDGMTALMMAVETRYLKLVQYLVDQKSNLNLINNSGMTALQIAQAKGYSELYDSLSGEKTVTVQGDSTGICSPMTVVLKLNQPNKVVLTTKNSMLMLTSKDLNINLMAGSGMDANTTVTPQHAGEFIMNCGPQMGSGNPEGKIIVQ